MVVYGQVLHSSFIVSAIVWRQYTLFLIRLGFILPASRALIKLIYAGRVPAITHKPLPGARVLLRPCECRPVCAYVICVYYGYIKAVRYTDYRVRFWGLKSP